MNNVLFCNFHVIRLNIRKSALQQMSYKNIEKLKIALNILTIYL